MSTRQINLDISKLQPHLNLNTGILEINVPAHEGPLFHPDFIEHLQKEMAPQEVDAVLDQAGDLVTRAQVGKLLSKAML